jgi:co-chaperonin GroES (HSP10)
MSTVAQKARAKSKVDYSGLTPDALKAPKPVRRKLSLRTPLGKQNKNWVLADHGGVDPKQDILDRIGKLPPDLTQLTRILVAIYQPPMAPKTGGGILLPDALSDEDREEYLWQGKVGLIVAIGPQAYEDDDTYKFHGTKNKVGDWVWFRPADGMGCEVNEVFCRVLRERDIIGKVDHPDQIW